VLYHSAWLEYRRTTPADALQVSEQACPILESQMGADSPALAWCLNDQSIFLSSLNRHDEAREKQQQAIDIWKTVLPEGHPHLAVAIGNLGSQYYQVGDFEGALAEYRKALAICRAAYPADHLEVGSNLCNVAFAERGLKRFEDAERHFIEGTGIVEAALGPDDRILINDLMGLEGVYLLQGRYTEALAIQDRVVRSYQKKRWARTLCCLPGRCGAGPISSG